MNRLYRAFSCAALILVLAGCGYSAKSALPSGIKTVYVKNFKNNINFTKERDRNIYFPLLEIRVRDEIVKRFQFDGNLRIAREEDADLVLEGELLSYNRYVLRYTDNDDPLEYRVQIFVNLVMMDTKTDEPFFIENSFAGEAEFFISGSQVTTEESAVEEATLDLARRIVERTIENW